MTRKESENRNRLVHASQSSYGAVGCRLTFDSLGNGEQNARDEGLAVVLLLEDDDLLSQTGPVCSRG